MRICSQIFPIHIRGNKHLQIPERYWQTHTHTYTHTHTNTHAHTPRSAHLAASDEDFVQNVRVDVWNTYMHMRWGIFESYCNRLQQTATLRCYGHIETWHIESYWELLRAIESYWELLQQSATHLKRLQDFATLSRGGLITEVLQQTARDCKRQQDIATRSTARHSKT